MRNLDDVYNALRAADAAGNTEDARKLAAYIRSVESEPQAQQEPTVDDQRYDMTMEGDYGVIPRDGAIYKGLVGAGRTFDRIGAGISDLYHRATGNEDALDSLNRKQDLEDLEYKRLSDRSMAAKVGEFVPELAVGVATGGLTSAAGLAGRAGTRAVLGAAAEGALYEGITNRGDLGERAANAGMGAAFGGGTQLGINGLTKGFTALQRSGGRYALDTSSEDALDAAAEGRKTLASEAGGYQLDDVDAYLDRTGASERSRLYGSDLPGPNDLRGRYAQQEADVTQRVSDLVDEGADGAVYRDRTERSENLAAELRKYREDDWRGVNEAYDAWRASPEAEGVLLNTGLVQEPIQDALAQASRAADKNVRDSVTEILTAYGVRETPQGPSVELTPNNYETMLQELNGLYSVNNNYASKKLISDVKGILDDNKYTMLSSADGASQEIIDLGREAAKKRADFGAKWEKQKVLDDITKKNPKTGEYAQSPGTLLSVITSDGKHEGLQKIKDLSLSSDRPELKRVWNDMQAAPLFEALEKATSGRASTSTGEAVFNDRAFDAAIGKLNKTQLKTLYGEEFANKLESNARARGLRERDIRGRKANYNPSGTAEASDRYTNALGRVAAGVSGGSVGQYMLGVVSMIKGLRVSGKSLVDEINISKLAKGELTTLSEAQKEALVKKRLKELYPNPEFTKYDSLFSLIARATLRPSEDEEN